MAYKFIKQIVCHILFCCFLSSLILSEEREIIKTSVGDNKIYIVFYVMKIHG